MTAQLQCQQEVGRFATTRDDADARAANIRAHGVSLAMNHIRNGERGKAYAAIVRSFHTQARAMGLHLHEPVDRLGRGSW